MLAIQTYSQYNRRKSTHMFMLAMVRALEYSDHRLFILQSYKTN
nr:MAG TPA: hypothetical protein [Caudoviricetes sp.]